MSNAHRGVLVTTARCVGVSGSGCISSNALTLPQETIPQSFPPAPLSRQHAGADKAVRVNASLRRSLPTVLPRSPCSCNDLTQGRPSFQSGSDPVSSLPETRRNMPGGPRFRGYATPILVAEGRSATRLSSGVCDACRAGHRDADHISWLSLPLLRLLLMLLLLLPQAVRGQTTGVGSVTTLAGNSATALTQLTEGTRTA